MKPRVILYRGPSTVTKLPPVKEGQIRCECGAAVRPRAGIIPNHQTPRAKVPCIHSKTEAP